MSTTIKELVRHLHDIAPPRYQESYDNSGLITGDESHEVEGVMFCLDATEEVIDEAVREDCNLVVAHHPILFRPIDRLTGEDYVQRTLIKAIRNEVAILAVHTNLDNVLEHGVNQKIAQRLGLEKTRILAPKDVALEAQFIVEMDLADELLESIRSLGHTDIFSLPDPSGQYSKFSVFTTEARQGEVDAILSSQAEYWSWQETARDDDEVGSGIIGELPEPRDEMEFLRFLKKRMKTSCVKYTPLLNREVKRVALCGGAGGFLLKDAIASGADVFITSDIKYHEFFDADGQIVLTDIGHYESEQFTIDLLYDIVSDKFSTFALHKTSVRTNPVNYLV